MQTTGIIVTGGEDLKDISYDIRIILNVANYSVSLVPKMQCKAGDFSYSLRVVNGSTNVTQFVEDN